MKVQSSFGISARSWTGDIFSRWVKIFDEQRRAKSSTEEPLAEQVAEGSGTPSNDYRAETLEILLALPPAGFERLSQRLLRESGFTQVVVTGQSGDGGIDGYGTLQINPLVSFKVLFQCKRYSKSVSRSHVRDFRGAMSGRADKGIVITTGTFTHLKVTLKGNHSILPMHSTDLKKGTVEAIKKSNWV